MSEILEAEWSHFIDASEITGEKVRMTITPDKEARKNLVRRLGLLSIDSLKAELELQREQGGMVVHIGGNVQAVLQQSCVVTLDPIETKVNETFEAWFADPDQAIQLSKVKHDKNVKMNGETPILDEREDPEPIIDDQIDLGDLVTQHLSERLESKVGRWRINLLHCMDEFVIYSTED